MIHQVVSEVWVFRMGSTILEHPVLRAYEGGSGGTSYPGPEELRLSRSVWSKNFFLPAQFAFLTLGMGRPKSSEDLFFALHLILGKNWTKFE